MDPISTPSCAWNNMSQTWPLIDDLIGGTQSMREAGDKWLPQETKEQPRLYEIRLNRTFLFGAFKDTIDQIVSRPFSKPVQRSAKLSARMESLFENVDGTGTSLHDFSRDLFKLGIKYGIAHVLVDFPRNPGAITLEEEKRLGLQPVWSVVSPKDLIGYQVRVENGQNDLLSIRIRETREVPDGLYATKEQNFIRVYTKTTWELWEETEKDKETEFVKVAEGIHTFGEVPLVTFYAYKTGFLEGECPLMDLAWANLEHWQSSSDQRNILRFMRCGILFAKGFDVDDLPNVVIGPSVAIKTTNVDADLSYVEHKGNALSAGQKDLEAIERRMEVLGLKPFIERTGRSTATGKMIEADGQQSDIQQWIMSCEKTLTKAIGLSGKWWGEDLPKDFEVKIFSEFSLPYKSVSDIDLILRMRPSSAARPSLITQKTALTEMKRRGFFPENFDVEKEVSETADELMSLDILGDPGDGDGDEDVPDDIVPPDPEADPETEVDPEPDEDADSE